MEHATSSWRSELFYFDTASYVNLTYQNPLLVENAMSTWRSKVNSFGGERYIKLDSFVKAGYINSM